MDGLLERGRLVEELGFDGLFVFDHPAIQADPWVCLSALVGVTERVRLGSVVNCVSYRHPALLARMAADLDVLSRGRLMLGLGIGWLKSEFRAFDVPFAPAPERHAALTEALAIVDGLWRGEPFSFEGMHYRVGDLQIAPPAQRPRPPIVIGGNGERVTLKLVARHADACNVSELQDRGNGQEAVGGAETIRRKLDALARHCDDAGRPYEEVLRTHFTLKLVLAPTAERAAAKLAAQRASPSASPATRRAQPSAFVVGAPERVAAHYRSLVEAGVQYFVVQLDATDRETLELLAGEVAPNVA
jgi:alkanesulfonate monooxygenase SsuD/methylene tetrahydromethanopterin reductase-like flavin-dependent oxidoreductase (luciferase family)